MRGVLALLAAVLPGGAVGCYAPGNCTAPAAAYSRVAPTGPRIQWGDADGYCGSLAVQTAALSHGAWVSQDQVRKSTGPGGGTGDKTHGYEISPTNIELALQTLQLTHDAWDWKGQPTPQLGGYLAWLKRKLAAGAPVVWFIICNSGGGFAPFHFAFDHVEPVWGIYSDRPLDGPVLPGDVLVHGSDWDTESYYRRFDSLGDTTAMRGNCSKADSRFKHYEAYPCLNEEGDYGYAVTGIRDPKGAALPASLAVDRPDEPDLRAGEPATMLHGTVTVRGLTVGQKYVLYRYDGYRTLPGDGDYAAGAYKSRVPFTATAAEWTHADADGIPSGGTTYYRAVAA